MWLPSFLPSFLQKHAPGDHDAVNAEVPVMVVQAALGHDNAVGVEWRPVGGGGGVAAGSRKVWGRLTSAQPQLDDARWLRARMGTFSVVPRAGGAGVGAGKRR